MTVLKRAAGIAAISICIAGAAGISTPGFASEMDKTPISTALITSVAALNGSGSIKVPTTPTPEIPGVTVERLPETTDDAATAADDGGVDYASLAAAVAAQPMPDSTTSDDLTCLAGAIYFESKGEPLNGQLAVADVIINRTKSGRFPSSICSVVTQPGQFSFVRHGRIPYIDTNRATYRTALAVAQIALAKAWDNPAPTALFFHAKRVSPGWGLTEVASIGHHNFYR
jgi:hypothetical protein